MASANPLMTRPRLVAYGRRVILPELLATVLPLILLVALIWAGRLARDSSAGAPEPADGAARPDLVSALDWPELRVQAVVPEPSEEPLALVVVGRAAGPRREATLLLALDNGDDRAVSQLSQWCAAGALVCASRQGGAALELRRGRSLERVHAVLVAEDGVPAA